jgi:hypothetical protein
MRFAMQGDSGNKSGARSAREAKDTFFRILSLLESLGRYIGKHRCAARPMVSA